MAKTLYKTNKGLRVKYIIKAKKYFIYYGAECISIDGKYQKGYKYLSNAVLKANNTEAEISNGIRFYTDIRKANKK